MEALRAVLPLLASASGLFIGLMLGVMIAFRWEQRRARSLPKGGDQDA